MQAQHTLGQAARKPPLFLDIQLLEFEAYLSPDPWEAPQIHFSPFPEGDSPFVTLRPVVCGLGVAARSWPILRLTHAVNCLEWLRNWPFPLRIISTQ